MIKYDMINMKNIVIDTVNELTKYINQTKVSKEKHNLFSSYYFASVIKKTFIQQAHNFLVAVGDKLCQAVKLFSKFVSS